MANKPAAAEDRPFSLAISQAELFALVRWHTNQANRINKAYGTAALKLQARNPFGCARDLKALGDEARNALDAHTTRARSLLSIL